MIRELYQPSRDDMPNLIPEDAFGKDYFAYSVRADTMAFRRRTDISETLRMLDEIRRDVLAGETI
jgi:hypothetical protein